MRHALNSLEGRRNLAKSLEPTKKWSSLRFKATDSDFERIKAFALQSGVELDISVDDDTQ